MTGLMHGAVTVSVTCMAQSSICPSCAQLLQNFAPIDAQDEGAAQPNPEPVSRFHFPQVCKRYAEYITEVPASKDEYCHALIRIANKLALSWTNSQFNPQLIAKASTVDFSNLYKPTESFHSASRVKVPKYFLVSDMNPVNFVLED